MEIHPCHRNVRQWSSRPYRSFLFGEERGVPPGDPRAAENQEKARKRGGERPGQKEKDGKDQKGWSPGRMNSSGPEAGSKSKTAWLEYSE